ncbi:Nucleolar protein 14 [Auxenochlorella protothecoides]|uniref:Nucleolar protein 14 n=1 Tax=Auxenochlorella protothecoides TaxID=3075 RepID=A0A087SSA6_AUXPR|nr:Nucleolar protein 14 [Auxenochlorella protothecoides]KFM28610.1 Nucleolar protein 14 [Auxenochlorella protothecoides]
MAKKKGPVKKRYGSKKAEPVPNLFERLSSHKKFDVLGRKKLNGPQEKSRLRSAAHELRKNTLLVEYKQLRKSNAFIDRRFGEDDESLTADEKALLRFQKQRMQELAGGKFALPDDTQEVELTHLGRSLAESQGLGEDWQRDDEDDGLPDYDVSAHFGGGDGEGGDLFQLKPRSESAELEGGDGDDAPAPRRSKAEVMEEVIAKSKAFRAAKQQQREEDVEEVEKLDSVFRELGAAGALSRLVRPKGAKGSLAGLESREDVAFDIAARELVYEAKGGPADRLKSQAELEAAENERAAKAEAALRHRLKAKDLGEGSDKDGEDVTDMLELPSGGFAARRAKAAAVAAAQGKKRKVSGEQQAAPSMLQRLPTTYPEFARLVEGLSAAELHETVGALRVTHAAALARDNRAGMQTFYGQLTQHFASVAAAGGQDATAALDALLPHLLELTAEVPLYAATLARARLSIPEALEFCARALRSVTAGWVGEGEDGEGEDGKDGLVARRPLVLAAAVRIAEARQYNPRFEDGYVATKDYDPDRERSERRKLQRQVRKEQRGAARELRKDGAFMAAVRDKEKATKQAALDKSAKRAMSFLQKQESDFKSGGQGGMWKKGKKF